MRRNIIETLNKDVVCLTETHSPNYKITVNGYKTFQQNWFKTGKKGSGGVAILVKYAVVNSYDITLNSNSVDGILGLKLSQGEYHLNVYNVYIPPENSPYGCDIGSIFAYLTGEFYKFSNEDVLMIGDFNAKVGELADITIEANDWDIPTRKPYNNVVNNHGKAFIKFMEDCRCCILNGRFDRKNIETSISVKGKAMVDYCVVPYHDFRKVLHYEVLDTLTYIERNNLTAMIDTNSKPPDHNVLSLLFKTDAIIDEINPNSESQSIKRKVVRKFPDNFWEKPILQEALAIMIEEVEQIRLSQDILDDAYSNWLHTFTEIINDTSNKRCLRKNTTSKPYWNYELKKSWHLMHDAHVAFKKSRENRKPLLLRYRYLRKCFDEKLKRATGRTKLTSRHAP